MKNILKVCLLLTFVCFSFFYTDKVINIINKNNPLMDKIDKLKDNYNVIPTSAVVTEDTIIPGIKGKEVNIYDSYEEMKIGKVFREDKLVYKEILPSNTLNNNKDKYIIKGNNKENKVSIIYIINNGNIDRLNNLKNITLFINHNYITKGNITKLNNYEIYSYGNNGIYTSDTLNIDNNMIKRSTKRSPMYCLSKEKNKEVLNICNLNNMYVVIPNIIGDYLEVKNNISNGSIILLNSLTNINEIIKYISGKGYEIVYLSELLEE